MKHHSFYNEYKEIVVKEKSELRECLKAHENFFSWEDEDTAAPIVTVGLDYYVGDVTIKRISFNPETDRVEIVGDTSEDYPNEVEFTDNEVHFGHLDFIMDYLPEPVVGD